MKKLLKLLFFAAAMTSCSMGTKGGLPDYCYVHASSMPDIPRQYWHLMGHKKWDADFQIGVFESIDDAVNAAKKIECPFR